MIESSLHCAIIHLLMINISIQTTFFAICLTINAKIEYNILGNI
jgi:hypothetical protein